MKKITSTLLFLFAVSIYSFNSGLNTEKEMLNGANTTPTDLDITSTSIDENASSGTTIGTLSTTDADFGDTFTYTLVSGTGDSDNGSFAISGDELQSAAIFNHETKDSYSVRIRTTDAGGAFYEESYTISIADINEIPSDLSLPDSFINENEPAGTTVGTFVTSDADDGDSFTYTLVSGTGDTDNGTFSISGNELKSNAVFNHEAKDIYNIRVRTTDSGGLFREEPYSIIVFDVTETPTDLSLSATVINENEVSGTTVGIFSTTDVDDGDSFTYTLVSGTGDTDNGSFSIAGNELKNAAVFDHETKDSYSIRVRTTDNGSLFREESYTITISDVNETPTAVALSSNVIDENESSGTTVGSISSTDIDDGDSFTYTLVSGSGDTDNASFSISGNQLLSSAVFDADTKSSYSIRIRTTDSGGLLFEDAFTITINGLPTAGNQSIIVNEGTLNNVIDLSLSATYGNDGAGFIGLDSNPSFGTVNINQNDFTISYSQTNLANPSTSDTFDYSIQDSNGDRVVGTISITINRLPTSNADAFTVNEDSSNNVLNVLADNGNGADDFDLDGSGSINLTSSNSTQGGTLSVDTNSTNNDATDDTIIYTPAADFYGTDTFTYTITDGNGDTSAATTVTLTVMAVDPHPQNDTFQVIEDSSNNSLDILANDVFNQPIGANLTITSLALSGAVGDQGGTISIDDNNTANDPTDDKVVYTPVIQYVGPEIFTYTLTDGNNDTGTATVTVNVVPVIPLPQNDSFTVNQDTENHVFDVLANDTFNFPSPDELATFEISGDKTAQQGTIILDDNNTPNDPTDDTVIYSPFATYNGADSFTYTLTDANGDSATATVNITVRPIVPVPVDDVVTVDKNSTGNIINVLANDDFGGNGPHASHPLTFTNGSLSSASVKGGTIVIENNAVTYTPATDFVGDDIFLYTLTDADGDATSASVTITVQTGANASAVPTANADTASVSGNTTDNVIDVLDNDVAGLDGFIDNGLTLTNGTSSGASDEGGLISVDRKGTADTTDDEFLYSPKVGFTGTDTFSYTITDATGDAATGTVTVTVGAPSPVESAVEDIVEVDENSVDNVIDVLANDTFGLVGTGTMLIISVDHLTATTSQGGTITLDDGGTPGIGQSDDKIKYTPPANFTGVDTFPYLLRVGGNDYTGTVTVTVKPVVVVNGTPTATADTASATQNGSAVSIAVLANDNFGTDGANTTHHLTFPNGSVNSASANGASIAVSDNGTANDLLDDVIIYTPGNFAGPTDTFDYVITDANGDASTATVTITVSASGTVSVPTAQDDTATVDANSTNNLINVLNNDSPGTDGYIDGGLTMTNGTLQSGTTEGGLITIDNKGTGTITDDEFFYTPKADFDGTDTFQYTITDASGDASTATVTVTVNPPPADVPAAVADTGIATENGGAVLISVLDNDNFGTDGLASLTLPLATSTSGGTLSVDDNSTGGDPTDDRVSYTPPANFTGNDTFNYTIEDTNGDTSTATVTIVVSEAPFINDTPTAIDDNVTVNRTSSNPNQIVYIDVTANDSYGNDGQNATHPLVLINGKTDTASDGGMRITVDDNGTPNNLSDDRIAYYSTNSPTFISDTFIYTITDGNGDASTATVNVTLSAVAPKPGGISDDLADNTFMSYPNPSEGNFTTVLFSGISTDAVVTLSDVTGRIVYRKNVKLVKGKNELELNANVKAGVKLLRITSKEIDYGMKKVIFK